MPVLGDAAPKKECHAKILHLRHENTFDKIFCTATCEKMIRSISHAALCKTTRDGGCRNCVQIMAWCDYYEKLCRQNQSCDVSFCDLLKFNLSKKQLRGEVANWKRLRARVEPLSPAVRPDVPLGRPNVWPIGFVARPLEVPQVPEAGPSNACHVQPAVEPQAGPSTAPHVPPALETQAGPSVALHVSAVDAEARPAIASHLQPGVGPDVQPALEPKKGPSTAPHVSPTVEPEAGPSTVPPAVDPQTRSSVALQFQPARGPGAKPPVEPYMGITIGPIATPSRPPVAAVRPVAGPGARMENIQLRPFPVHVQFEGVDVTRPVEPYAQASIIVQLERPRAGMVQQPHRHPPPANWRRTVSARHRQHQVRKLVNSITRFYPPGYQGLIEFGIRLENIMFGRATSLPNYYHLIGEQMNRMPIELEDHRRLMIRAQWNNEVPNQQTRQE